MRRLRTKRISQIFCYVFAILIFNISIDPPDMLVNLDNDVELEEDLNINEMESVAEVILEQGFDIKNALPESDDPDSDNLLKKLHFFALNKDFYKLKQLTFVSRICKNPNDNSLYYYTGFFSIISPPPELS